MTLSELAERIESGEKVSFSELFIALTPGAVFIRHGRISSGGGYSTTSQNCVYRIKGKPVTGQFGDVRYQESKPWLTSIDAAVKLLEEVLGEGWLVNISINDEEIGRTTVYLNNCRPYPNDMYNVYGRAPTPAAALVAAILRAKEAQNA